jgi:CheY-like chemotaxis protein
MTAESDRLLQILILEDEGLIALDLESIVRSLGFKVLGPLGSLDAALRMVEEEQIDGAVLDIHLNDHSTSYPVAAALESRRIPFMFVTAVDKGGVAPLFPDAAVVRKPFSYEQIQTAVKLMMAKLQ